MNTQDTHPTATSTTNTTATGGQTTMERVKEKAMNLVDKVTGKPTATTEPAHHHDPLHSTNVGPPGHDTRQKGQGQHLHYDPVHPQTQTLQGQQGHPTAGGGMAGLASDYNAAPDTKTDSRDNKVLSTMPAPNVAAPGGTTSTTGAPGGTTGTTGALGSTTGTTGALGSTTGTTGAPGGTTSSTGVPGGTTNTTAVPVGTHHGIGGTRDATGDTHHPISGTHHGIGDTHHRHDHTTAAGDKTHHEASKMTRIKNDILHPDDTTRPHTERHLAEMGNTLGGGSTGQPVTGAVPPTTRTSGLGGGIPPAAGAGGAATAANLAHQHPAGGNANASVPTGHTLAHDPAAAYHAGQVGGSTLPPGQGNDEALRNHHRLHAEQVQQNLGNKPLPGAPDTTTTMSGNNQHHGMAPAGPTGTTAIPEYSHAGNTTNPMTAGVVPAPNMPGAQGHNQTAMGGAMGSTGTNTKGTTAPGDPSMAPSAQLYPDPQGTTNMPGSLPGSK